MPMNWAVVSRGFTMSTAQYLSDDELIERAIKALIDALGPGEAIRFLTMPRPQRLDSVQQHRQWQDSLDPQQFFEQVFGPPSLSI
jgi:hypothetical protein